MKIYHQVIRPAKFAISCIVFLLTLEICARVDDTIKYNAPFWGYYSDDRLRSRDSEGDPFNVPNVGFEKWQHNSLGFRGPDISPIKPSSTIRIVCMGASETYGLHESPNMEWPAQLQTILGHSRYQVINASVAGITLFRFNSYLRKHVFPLQPDIIIFTINPLFYATIQEHPPKPDKKVPRRQHTDSNFRFVSIPSHFRLFPKLKQVLKQSISDYFPETLNNYQIQNLNRQIKELERVHLNGTKPKDSVPESYVISFRHDLEALIKSCNAQGINVILTTYPSLMTSKNIENNPVLFLDLRRFCIEFSNNGIIDIVNKFNLTVSSLAMEEHLMFVDTNAILPKSTLYFADNVHYTDLGSRMIAERIAKNILSPRQARILYKMDLLR
jgi:hypothetical protein